MSPIPCWQVDAFTSRPFGGNPAAVCWLESEVTEDWMQAVAAEMNLSETAFVRRLQNGYGLRWFTPQVEVDLCGHATLASAHVLWTTGIHSCDEPIHFETRSGLLTCSWKEGTIEMDFPSKPFERSDAPSGLLAALGLDSAVDIGKNRFDHLVVVENAEIVRSLAPDFGELRKVRTRGTIVTSRSDESCYDFVSRFFAPAVGINEDPVTGSAHCCLGPYWSEVLGKPELVALQASRREGVVQLRVHKDRVELGGPAVTVWQGNLLAVPHTEDDLTGQQG